MIKASQYERSVNRLIRGAVQRAKMTGQKTTLMDLPTQIAIRSVLLKKATINVEITALRKVLNDVRISQGTVVWPPAIDADGFAEGADRAQLVEVKNKMALPSPEILEGADHLMVLASNAAYQKGHEMDIGEMQETLADLSGRGRNRTSQKDSPFVSYADILEIVSELSMYDPRESLASIEQGVMTGGKVRAKLHGTLRLLSTTMWHTGMRFIELWQFCFLVPRTDMVFSAEMRELVRQKPMQAVDAGYFIPVETAAVQHGSDLDHAAKHILLQTRLPAILLITSAKTTNQNAELGSPVRIQIVDPETPPSLLELLTRASQCRHLNIPAERYDGIRSSLVTSLKKLCDNSPRFDGRNVNLHAMRHSFSTRAKAVMSPYEVAALTGHTSRNTLSGYGQRNTRKGSLKLNSQDTWLPLPDPEQVERLKTQWTSLKMAPDLSAETDMEAHASFDV